MHDQSSRQERTTTREPRATFRRHRVDTSESWEGNVAELKAFPLSAFTHWTSSQKSIGLWFCDSAPQVWHTEDSSRCRQRFLDPTKTGLPAESLEIMFQQLISRQDSGILRCQSPVHRLHRESLPFHYHLKDLISDRKWVIDNGRKECSLFSRITHEVWRDNFVNIESSLLRLWSNIFNFVSLAKLPFKWLFMTQFECYQKGVSCHHLPYIHLFP